MRTMPYRRQPSISVAAALVWNNLPLVVRSAAYLQEPSQDTSLPVVIQPLTFCSDCLAVFNQQLHVLEIVTCSMLSLMFH